MAVVVDDVPSMSMLPSLDPTALSSSSAAGLTPIREFEPVLNAPAAASFFIIAVVFALLQFRINAVANAAARRASALEALRRAESLQLAGDDSDARSGGVSDASRLSDRVAIARDEYENSLRAEMDLRTIVPGVRIVAPNDPKRDEEERAAAKRFLGWGGEEFGDDPDDDIARKGLGSEGSTGGDVQSKGNDVNAGISNSAKVILFGTASMLIVLLWALSFDPMVADQVLTTLGGSPPSNMPLSSW